MPEVNAPKAVNPRFDAMKAIVSSRLNDGGTESGKSLREEMEAQGVEMVDPDAALAPDVKDSDSHLGVSKEVEVDIDSKTFTPDVEDIKTETDPPAEEFATEDLPAAEPKVTSEPTQETVGEPVYEKGGKLYTKIIVNGVEEEMDFDTLKASAQKDRASFERFQAAAAKEQELESREARLNTAEAKKAVVPNTPAQPAMTEKEQDDTVDKLYDSLAYEDEDTVKAKLAEIVSRGASPQDAAGREEVSTQSEPVDIQVEVEAALERKAVRDWEIARTAAVAQWEIDYADINGDEALRNFANEETARIAHLHPQQPIHETLKQAGEKAREWRDFQAGKAPTVNPAAEVDIESRKADKRAAAAPVRANGTAAARQVEDNKPPSRSDVVASIRAGRGQQAV